ncbi:putative methylesterase 11, chloroplastic isoform X1 [Zingiber officinale]|uniref:putative methylesterase 11, chloroplastic isoform X1 n=1 Tax=Zingiber officinale TaxID=94328 RepID=UPI001C4CD7F4|nr:putative methylesterase 11, chloroplastic isoform X1 [Zingiber officinale]
MGGVISCFSDADEADRKDQRRRPAGNHLPSLSAEVAAIGIGSEDRISKGRSRRKGNGEAVLTHEQALAAALLLQQNGGVPGELNFDRSSSLRFPGHGKKRQTLPRSSSSRPPSLTDPVLQPQQLVNQGLKIDNLEIRHFVLVHGGGFGAWCWYKSIALLEDSGFKVSAIDLTGSGISSFNTNKVSSIAEYAKPLTGFLEALGDLDKVILVGHDFGGVCVSYAMEVLPSKVGKAIFICAAMPTTGQNILDMFSEEAGMLDLMRQAQVFVYGNGKDLPPTAIDLDKSLLKELLFNQSPSKDVALALVSIRSIPFAPVLEKLSLTENYGSVRRFFIETTEDNAIPLQTQQRLCNVNPPERVFQLKGSDHSPFFSKPLTLHKILVEIATMPSN